MALTKISGSIIKDSVSLSGNVSVGGTLTYQDVTNVDALGIGTFRTGIKVLAGQVDVGNNIKLGNAGVITATSFVGDGSGLTGAGPSLTGSTNNTIVTVTGANAIQGESSLTYDGTSLKIGGDSGVSGTWNLETYNSGGDGMAVIAGTSGARLLLQDTVSGEKFLLAANGQASLYSQGAGDNMVFYTKPSGGSDTERLRIASNGQITTRGASGTSFNNAGAGDFGSFLTVNGGHTANQWGILSLEGNTSANGYAVGAIQFINQNNANGSSGANTQSRLLAKIDVQSVTSDSNAGDDSGGSLTFFTKPEAGNPAERLRITSTGLVKIQGDGGNTGFFLSNAYSQGSMLGGMYYNGSSWVRDAVGTRKPAGVFLFTGGNIAFLTAPESSGTTATPTEKVRITNTGQLLIGTTSGSEILCIKRDDATGPTITLENDSNKAYINNWGSSGGGSGRTNRFEINATSQAQASYCAPYHTFMTGGVGDSNERLRIMPSGTLKALYHATSRNGIVQVKQVTSNTRYSGSIASVDLITGSTFSPKTSDPRFLIMIFCPVNTSDDSDAGGSNRNDYFYGRIEYRKSGGGWIECNDQGSTAQQGGYAAHVELSPNRTGNQTTDYWSGNRYRMEHKQATVLVTNVGDCGSGGTVQFKLRGYSHGGSFVHIGQPHGNGTDDNYSVQPWGFTVFELAPDNNSYTAY